ncbi:MAG: hypothetical protein FH756_01725 [Firmicutes bacterium]|nr:hypothetical protein [Bacillota bacterium]
MEEKDREVCQRILSLLEEEYQPEFDRRNLGPVHLHFAINTLKQFAEQLESIVSKRVKQTPICQILQEDQH